MIAFALSLNVWMASIFLLFSGWTILGVFAIVNSLVQLHAKEELRGRIMSVYNTAFRGAMPLGNFSAGLLADRFSAPATVMGHGVLLILVALVYLARKHEVTRL